MQRRRFLHNTALLGAGLSWQALLPAWAQSAPSLDTDAGLPAMHGSVMDLHVREVRGTVAGKRARHITLNDQFPAPLLRWREGDELTLSIHNALTEPTSIHWHGLLLPWQMDGVPGVSFTGIAAGESFTYRFTLKQAGTYWYHSHSGLQEQLGHYGPIIIDPLVPPPYAYEREYVVLLSDWAVESPERIFSRLKKMSAAYNYQQRTVFDFFRDVQDDGLDATLAERMMWGQMRMNRTDLADVTAASYTWLVNGHSPAENWTALFRSGERIRLRIINASAMSIFNVRIPGLPMTVVQADGLDVRPLVVDEFQIGTAETFDVIVSPREQAYTLMAESNDRSGYAAATLAPRAGMQAAIPPLRPRPLLTMKDMGMAHAAADTAAMDHAAMGHAEVPTVGTDHAAMGHGEAPIVGMEHAAMGHNEVSAPAMDHSTHTVAPSQAHSHAMGPGVSMVAANPVNRLHERPLGLEDAPHRVLVYGDLRSLASAPDTRAPARELELHLTASMERYMWSFDGLKFSEVTQPIPLRLNERVRLTLVNDTMMPHPIHLHGMYFDVVTAVPDHRPRKHTLVIKPAEKLSVDISADAPGEWAFHCHLLYHMHAGMMRVFSVSAAEASR